MGFLGAHGQDRWGDWTQLLPLSLSYSLDKTHTRRLSPSFLYGCEFHPFTNSKKISFLILKIIEFLFFFLNEEIKYLDGNTAKVGDSDRKKRIEFTANYLKSDAVKIVIFSAH